MGQKDASSDLIPLQCDPEPSSGDDPNILTIHQPAVLITLVCEGWGGGGGCPTYSINKVPFPHFLQIIGLTRHIECRNTELEHSSLALMTLLYIFHMWITDIS